MSLIQLIHLIKSFPPNLQQEVALFASFLQEREAKHALPQYSASLELPEYTQPLVLEEYTVQNDDLEALEEMWADEEDADTLCMLLTA